MRPKASNKLGAMPLSRVFAPSCLPQKCQLRSMVIASAAKTAATQFRQSDAGQFLEQYAAHPARKPTNAQKECGHDNVT